MSEQGLQENKVVKKGPLRRLGCIIGLIIWLFLVFSPCLMIVLAVRGEIALTTGSAPEQKLRIWLIQEAAQSGVGFSNVDVLTDGDQLCVQTNVRFMLWRGQAEPAQYCECYTRTETDWQLLDVSQDACIPTE
jgi:predicted membrane protein